MFLKSVIKRLSRVPARSNPPVASTSGERAPDVQAGMKSARLIGSIQKVDDGNPGASPTPPDAAPAGKGINDAKTPPPVIVNGRLRDQVRYRPEGTSGWPPIQGASGYGLRKRRAGLEGKEFVCRGPERVEVFRPNA